MKALTTIANLISMFSVFLSAITAFVLLRLKKDTDTPLINHLIAILASLVIGSIIGITARDDIRHLDYLMPQVFLVKRLVIQVVYALPIIALCAYLIGLKKK